MRGQVKVTLRWQFSDLHSRYSLRLLTFFAILLPLIPLRGIIAPADHAGYIELIQEAGNLQNRSGLSAKQYIGIFYNIVEKIMPYWVFTNGVFFLYLFFITLAIRTLSAYFIALVVTLPMFIHFNYVSKEAILGFLAMSGVISTLLFGKKPGKITLIVGVIIFAIFVRPYYVIPITATAAVMLLGMKRGLILLFVGLILTLLTFPLPFEMLEGSRRQMYLMSIYKFGTRTVYPNIWIDDHYPLQLQSVVNYVIVFFETLFPISWASSLKDMFAQIFMCSSAILVFTSMRSSDRMFATFGLFLILTVPFFSPDLGTSMRHISAAVLYLHIGIALQRVYDGGKLGFRPLQLLPIYPRSRGRIVK